VVGTVSWGDATCTGEGHFARTDYNDAWIQKQITVYFGHDDGSDDGVSGDDEPVDPCDGITWEGVCDGTVAIWCESGELVAYDCALDDQICGYTGSEYGNYCMQPDDPCGGYTYEGTCEGNVTVWCEDGQVRREDCSNSGTTCTYDDIESYYDCV
jgi:hypothetical protein